jgi:3'(2'), 5'-bisphosphate nucleotidase
VVELANSALGDSMTSDQIISAIDLGSHVGGKGRWWTLDPIDGTKGFLRGGQFAVCLALVLNSSYICLGYRRSR